MNCATMNSEHGEMIWYFLHCLIGFLIFITIIHAETGKSVSVRVNRSENQTARVGRVVHSARASEIIYNIVLPVALTGAICENKTTTTVARVAATQGVGFACPDTLVELC